MYIDFHTHRQRYSENEDALEILSVHPGRHIKKGLFTIGYHPWWVHAPLTSNELSVLETELTQNPDCMGLGECGLDALKGIDLEIQEEVFIQQLQLANQLGSPVIIHCVRAFDRLIRLRKKWGKTDWVIHGFMRNATLAGQLVNSGCYLSMAPYSEMKDTFKASLQLCPENRIFLETDSDGDKDIKAVYTIAANVRNTSVIALQNSIFENFKNFFRWKQAYLPGWKEQNC